MATALFKRGLRGQMIQGALPLHAPKESMVGEAYTCATSRRARTSNTLAVFRDPAHPQRVAVEECPPGAVLVFDSRKDAARGVRRRILVGRLKMRGVAGVVTDGGFRDSPEIAGLASRPSTPPLARRPT